MKKHFVRFAIAILVLATVVALGRGILWLRGVSAELDSGLQGPRFSLPSRRSW